MIILHAAPITAEPHSGPNSSVPGLVAAQNGLPGVQAALAATLGLPGIPPDLGILVVDGKSLFHPSGKIGLPSPFDRPDLVVFHSTYIPVHARIASRLRRAGIPYLICPRGGMTRGATGKKRLKKRLGNLLFFNRLVRGAAAVHCLNEGEAALSAGWGRPALVVGNGIPLPPRADLANVRQTEQVRLTFMGRLDIHHKGLDLLLDACRIIRKKLADANTLVALHGPDADGSVRELRNRIGIMGLDKLVSVGPPVSGPSKAELLKQSDGFLHTSRFEGLPMAVLEALAHGVPCLLTPGTNMADEVARFGAGWKVETTPKGVAAGITRALSEDRDVWVEAGRNARRLVEERYRWDVIGRKSVEQYRRFAG